jgi:cytochrome c-type biogenesis protein CcmF
MAQLGQAGLLVALVLAGYGTVAAFAGGRTGRPSLVESARRAGFAVLVAVAFVNAAMLAALLRNDFALRYVAENSSRETPTFFKVLSLWAADDGSLLLWNLVLAGYLGAVSWRFRRERPAILPYALGVLFAVQSFYLVLVNGPARPFAVLAAPPPDGRGPSPLLQNHPLMAVHPPFLYLGFIGFTVPFAFGMAALLTGSRSGQWVALVRRWTLAVWCFLTVGLALGALWSYSVLGWGGYWAWDPVENVALLPWLVATAFLHSVMLQRRRSMASLWNLSLVIGAFALTTFGTFLTRGSILVSIHTFARSAVGPAYLGFLTLVLVVGFGLVAWRSTALRSPTRLDAVLSREAAIIANNVLLLSAVAVVLIGTAAPLAVAALGGPQLSVGRPFFTGSLAPVLLLLLLLVGTAPLLPWRATSPAGALTRLRVPLVAGASVMLLVAVVGGADLRVAAGCGLVALLLAGHLRHVGTALLAARRAGGRRAVRRRARSLAGYLVHLGLGVLAAGIVVSSGFAQQAEVSLSAGQSTTFAGYQVRYDGMRAERQPQRTVLHTPLEVTTPSGRRTRLDPRLNLYPAASEPIGSPAIDRGAVWDLYATTIALQDDGRSATVRLYHNPGVNWLWLGAALMVAGGGLAWWPRRRVRSPAAAEAGPDAAAADTSSEPGRTAGVTLVGGLG